MNILRIVLRLVCLAGVAEALANRFIVYKNFVELSRVAMLIVEKDFVNQSTTMIVSDRYLLPRNRNIHSNILRYVLDKTNAQISVQLHIGFINVHVVSFNLIIVDSVEAFRLHTQQFPSSVYHRDFYFLIVFTNPSLDYKDDVLQILQICWEMSVVNVNLIVEPVPGDVRIYTYFPFAKTHCKKVVPIVVNRILGGIPLSFVKTFFPPKLYNMHGCPLRIVARHYPPLLINKKDLGSEHADNDFFGVKGLGGIEGSILTELSKNMNFSIELVPRLKNLPDLGSNGSSLGMFIQLANGECDIAIGALSTMSARLNAYSNSLTYHQTPFVFLIKSKIDFSPLSQLIYPYSYGVWIMMTFYLSCVVGTVIVLKRRMSKPIQKFLLGVNNTYPYLNLFAVTFGYPSTAVMLSSFSRCIVLCWLLGSLILRNVYQGALFDSIRMNRQIRLPSTIGDLERMHFKVLTNYDKGMLLDGFTHLKERSYVLNMRHMEIFDFIQSSEYKLAALALLDQVSFYNKIYLKSNQFHILKENVFVKQISFFYKKHSYLKPGFDEKLDEIDAYGVIKSAVNFYANPKYNRAYPGLDEPPVITGDRLIGIYIVYGVMMTVASAVFAVEVLSQKYTIFENVVKFVD